MHCSGYLHKTSWFIKTPKLENKAGASFAARVFAESALLAQARNHPLESPALQGLQGCEASLHLQGRGL
jgi:hypothetical protein